jgi:hypothetical protein
VLVQIQVCGAITVRLLFRTLAERGATVLQLIDERRNVGPVAREVEVVAEARVQVGHRGPRVARPLQLDLTRAAGGQDRDTADPTCTERARHRATPVEKETG